MSGVLAVLGLIATALGVLLFAAAKSALHESTAAIISGIGLMLIAAGVISAHLSRLTGEVRGLRADLRAARGQSADDDTAEDSGRLVRGPYGARRL